MVCSAEFVIGRCGLDDWADGNEVLKARKKIHLIEAPSNWKSIILIGHTRIGPFTIVEGNNRIVAYMSSNRNGLDVPVYVGLGLVPCIVENGEADAAIARLRSFRLLSKSVVV
jgi:hypothetical protein